MMQVASVQCSHCGTINTTQSQACLQCGYILSAKAPRKTTRRKLLIGGGAFLVGCVAINDVHMLLSGPLFPDKHLLYEMNWANWLNFAWTPDSKQLLCLERTGEVAILDITKKQIRFLKQNIGSDYLMNSTFFPSWSNDRKHLVFVENVVNFTNQNNFTVQSTITVQSREDGTRIQIRAELEVLVVAWSPDGSQLVYYSRKEGSGGSEFVLSVWEIQGRKPIWKRVVPTQRESFPDMGALLLTWSPDGKSISFSFRRSSALYVWRASDGQQLWEQRLVDAGGISLLSWSADSSALAVSSDLLYTPDNNKARAQGTVWNAQTGQKNFETQMVTGHTVNSPDLGNVPFFVWSPTGARLAFFVQQYGKPVMHIWDAYTRRHFFSSQPLNSTPGSISWSPDGRIIAAGSYVEPGSQRVWDIAEYGSKSTIQFWNAQNGQELVSYEAPRRPTLLTWSPDSRFLAVVNMQTFECVFHGCYYGIPGEGVGSQNFMVALQIFQAPTLTSKKE